MWRSAIYPRPHYQSIIRITFILVAAALGCVASSAQEPKVLAPHRPVEPKLPFTGRWHKPAVPRSMVGGLWMIDANFKSTIYLKNDVKVASLTVTPILWLSNGKMYQLANVTLEPSGTATVDINQELAKLGIAPYATLTGYVEVRYTWPWDAICVTIRDLDVVHSLIFTYNLQPATMPNVYAEAADQPSTVLEGLWWKQESNIAGFVSLANPFPDPITVNVQVTDNQASILAEHTVTVSPHGNKLLQLEELQSAPSNEGGVRVTWEGQENRVLVYGGLQDSAVGFSARLTFHFPPPSSLKPTTFRYAAVGMMTGEADPMMRFPTGTTFAPYSILRNISDEAVTVQPRLRWMGGSTAHSAPLPQVTIQPYHAVNLNLASLISTVGPMGFTGSVTVTFDFQGKLRALLIATGSVDQKNTYVFEVHPQGVLESVAKTLSYWGTANGDDTMITLWNPADEAQDLVFTLFFSGGQYHFPVNLGPKAMQMFNLSEVIESHLPDSEGNVIPAGVHEGSAEISGPQGENEHILVSMDAGIYNVQKATCGTQYCLTCQGASDEWVDANPFAVGVGTTTQQSFTVQYESGTQYNLTSTAAWSSSNTSIGTVSAGIVTGVSAGSFDVSASESSTPHYAHACYPENPDGHCPINTGVSGSAPGTAGATPIKFALDSAIDLGGGDLHLVWSWESSSGDLSDLSACSVSESVTYPGTGNYTWPTPFPLITSQNPTTGSVPGSDGQVVDDHDLAGKLDTNFRKPYSANSFAAQQTISYSRSYQGKPLSGTLFGAASITRSVAQNTNASWHFGVVEPIEGTNYSATINPLP